MSGSISGIASGLQGISQALGGGVVIGGVRLEDFEVPEQVNFGGSQRLVTHKMLGGLRVIDAMGPDDADVSWRGMMLGANAAQRARQLDEMRMAGETITLLFGPFSRRVVISEFTAEYKRQNWIGSYSLRCTVLPSETYNSEPGLLDGVLGDITSALGIDTSTLSAVTSTLKQAQSVASAVGNLLPGASGVGSVLGSLNGVTSAIGAAQSLAEGNLGAAVGRIASTGSIGGSAAFGAALSAAKGLAAAASAGAYIGRAAANLGSAKG